MAIIAAIQFETQNTLDESLVRAEKYIQHAVANGAKCIVFPEEFLTLRMTAAQKLELAEPYQKGPLQSRMSAWAKQYDVWLVGGTLPTQSENSRKYYSSCMVWDNAGLCVARYNKIHLFDIDIVGGESYRESEQLEAGKDFVIIPTPFGKMGIAICYDIRFAELFRFYALNAADILLLPSAFTQPTGKAHWEILLRARAIENLSYVIAADQVGTRLNGFGTYGHSMIINPWGEILAMLEDEPGVILADIDLDKTDKIRERLPALKHYKPFILHALADVANKEKQ